MDGRGEHDIEQRARRPKSTAKAPPNRTNKPKHESEHFSHTCAGLASDEPCAHNEFGCFYISGVLLINIYTFLLNFYLIINDKAENNNNGMQQQNGTKKFFFVFRSTAAHGESKNKKNHSKVMTKALGCVCEGIIEKLFAKKAECAPRARSSAKLRTRWNSGNFLGKISMQTKMEMYRGNGRVRLRHILHPFRSSRSIRGARKCNNSRCRAIYFPLCRRYSPASGQVIVTNEV